MVGSNHLDNLHVTYLGTIRLFLNWVAETVGVHRWELSTWQKSTSHNGTDHPPGTLPVSSKAMAEAKGVQTVHNTNKSPTINAIHTFLAIMLIFAERWYVRSWL
jgi:hypothetical protein